MIALISIARKGLEVCKISVSSGSSSQTSISHPRVIVLGTGGSTSSNNLVASDSESVTLSMLAKEVLNYFALRNGSVNDNFATNELYVNSTLNAKGESYTKNLTVDGDLSTLGSVSGYTGKGLTITTDSYGIASGEIDNLTVRQTMRIYELLIEKLRAIDGGLVLSQASGTVDSVAETPTRYVITLQEDYSSFVAGDFIRCQSFDGQNVRGYWVEIESVENNTVTIPKSEFEGYSTPEVGDEMVQMGNSTDTSRQGMLYLSTTDDGLPRMEVLSDINSKDLSNKSRTVVGALDGIDGCEGYGLWSSNAYLTGKMTIGSGSSGLENLDEWNDAAQDIEDTQAVAEEASRLLSELRDYVDGTIYSELESLQAQIDGQLESFFYDYDPTLENYPASQWESDTDKETHLNDTFTNSETGASWRWSLSDGSYQWVAIADTATSMALQIASEAQDTADGKRRVFVVTPSPEYEVGDMWVQGSLGDIMVCIKERLSGSYVSSDWATASKYTDDSAAEALQQDVNTLSEELEELQEEVDSINDTVADVVSDSILTPAEKVTIKLEWDKVVAEYSSYNSEATTYGVSVTSYNSAYSTLSALVTPVLSSMSSNSTLSSSSTWISAWSSYGTQKVALAAAIETAKVNSITYAGTNLIDSSNGFTRYWAYNSLPTYHLTRWIETTKVSTSTYIAIGTSSWAWSGMDNDFYTLSGYIYLDGEIPATLPFLRFHTGAPYATTTYSSTYDSETGYFTITQEQGGYTSSSAYIIHASLESAYQDFSTIRFEYLMLVRGSKATAWGLAPSDTEYLYDAFKSDTTLISGGTSIGTVMAVKSGSDIKAGMCGDTSIAPFLFAEPQGSDSNMYNNSLFRVMSDGTGGWGIFDVQSDSVTISNDDNQTIISSSDMPALASLFTTFSSPSFTLAALSSQASKDTTINDVTYGSDFTISASGVQVTVDTSYITISCATAANSASIEAGYYLQQKSGTTYSTVGTLAKKTAYSTDGRDVITATTYSLLTLSTSTTYRIVAYCNISISGTCSVSGSTSALSGSTASFSRSENKLYIAPNGTAAIYGTTHYDYTARQSSGALYKECRSGNAGIRVNSGTLELMISGTWRTISRNTSGYLVAT